MEYTVGSLKDAINVSLDKLGYDKKDINIIRKLIMSSINGKANYFTRHHGARIYVQNKINSDDIMNEIIDTSKTKANNIDDIVDDYINKFFSKKQENLIDIIKQKSDFNKINKKLRHISTESLDDNDFYNNSWNVFCNIFRGNDKSISKEEIRYDMIEAALEVADSIRDEAEVLKTLDLADREINKKDAIHLVEEYVYSNNMEDLIRAINHNQILSGLLLQNLLDYVSFDKNKKQENDTNKLDSILDKIDLPLNEKANILKDKYFELCNLEQLKDITKEEIIVDLINNSLKLNIYSSKQQALDYEERRLYTGNKVVEEKVIENRIINNNKIINNFLYNGLNTSIEDIVKTINNLDERDIYFLTNIYVISRSTEENKKIIDNPISNSSKEQIYLLGLLEDKNLLEQLKQNKENTL